MSPPSFLANGQRFPFFIRVVFKGLPPLPQIGLWTFEPAFSPRFSPILSPRSFFPTGQRFLLSNHVTSGSMSPPSFLANGQRFPFFIRVVFKGLPPLPQIGLWTFEPAFSPRFSPILSPRSIFSTGQRFPISNHVTSGSHESPPSYFPHWSAVSHTGNDMTSSICSRPIRSQFECQTSPIYYCILFSVQSPSAGRLAPTCTTQLASLLQVTLDLLESHAASISTTDTSDSLQFPTRHLPFPLHGLTLSSLRRLCLFAL